MILFPLLFLDPHLIHSGTRIRLLLFHKFLTLYELMVFHWSLGKSKSPQVSRTLLSIVANLGNVVVRMVLILPLISNSSSCNILAFDPAVNRETGASGRRYQGITLTDWIRCKCHVHKKQVVVKQLYNPVPQTVRSSWSQLVGVRVAVRGSDNQLETEGFDPQDPGWAAQQNEKEVLLWPGELGVSMLQSVPSPTHLSHTTLSQPFLKKCVRSSLLLITFPHVYVYV